MLAAAADLDLIAAADDVIAHTAVGIELGAELIEIGHLEIGAEPDLTRVRLQLAQQQLEQRRFAGTIGADDPDPVAAQDQGVEILDDRCRVGVRMRPRARALARACLCWIREGHVLGLDHQLAAALAAIDAQARLPESLAPGAALLAQRLQGPHPPFVARAPGLDALANPDLLLGQAFVEALALLGLGMQALLAPAQIVVVIARPIGELAAIEFEDAGGQIAQEAPIMGDEQQRALETEHQLFEPFDGLDVEMVGRLVEQQQIRLADQRARQHHAPAQPAGEGRVDRLAVQPEARDHPLGALLDLPAVVGLEALLHGRQPRQIALRGRAAIGGQTLAEMVILGHPLAQRAETAGDHLQDPMRVAERRLLRQPRHAQPVGTPERAGIGLDLAIDELEQGALAGAVAADEADALGRTDLEIDPIEQRRMAIGERDGAQREQ